MNIKSYLLYEDNNPLFLKYLNILPKEYQQVEYIESTGTQYIDTGIILRNNNWRIETDIKYTEYTDSRQLIGSVTSGYYFGINTDGYYELGGTSLSNVLANLDDYDKVIYSNNSNTNVKTLNVNDTDVITRTNGSPSANNNYIFATGGNAKNYCKMRLKSYKLTIGNTLMLNLVPCYRKSDNEVGLYDLVNDEFYTNQGTGDFTIPESV